MKEQKQDFEFLHTSLDAIAQLVSMAIESLNMQIKSEDSDINDKKKMSLMGAKESKITKLEMHGSIHERMPVNLSSILRDEDGRVNEPVFQNINML